MMRKGDVLIIVQFSVLLIACTCEAQKQQKQKIASTDRAITDRFGHAVNISGSFAIVGAYQQDLDANGLNNLTDAGAAYIYERSTAGVWIQKKKLVASDRAANDLFGYAVAISGSYAIVSAIHDDEEANGSNTLNNSGSIYFFERNGSGNWLQVQKLTSNDRGANDEFGYSVSISGSTAIVGAYLEDEDANNTNTLTNAGSAYLFERNGSGVWSQVQKINSSDRAASDGFGVSVSVSNTKCIVGAYQEDENASGINTRTDAGSAYLFERNTSGVWIQVKKIVASDRTTNDKFGISVCIDDTIAVVGAFNQDKNLSGIDSISDAGAAYVYTRNTSGLWLISQKIIAADRGTLDWFGYSVSISGTNIIAGAYQEDEDANSLNTKADAGSAYIFKRIGSSWFQEEKIVSTDRAVGDNFGVSVGVSGNLFLVGAFSEDENANGTNTLNNAGSAYFFGCPTWFADADKDGYGNPLQWIDSCFQPTATYVTNNLDCNDNNIAQSPGLQEVCNNATDDNCNGSIDETICFAALFLTVRFQGLYHNTTMSAIANRTAFPTICDTITVALANSTSPYAIVYTSKGVINTNGQGTFNFPSAAANIPYYLIIRHRNSIETWSKNPVTLSSNTSVAFSF